MQAIPRFKLWSIIESSFTKVLRKRFFSISKFFCIIIGDLSLTIRLATFLVPTYYDLNLQILKSTQIGFLNHNNLNTFSSCTYSCRGTNCKKYPRAESRPHRGVGEKWGHRVITFLHVKEVVYTSSFRCSNVNLDSVRVSN